MSSRDGPVAITGADGFIGRNLVVRLREQGYQVHPVVRRTSPDVALAAVAGASIVFHLAGANRPSEESDFERSNRDYTGSITEAIAGGGRKPLVIFSSTTKAVEGSPYGRSKKAAEELLLRLAGEGAATVSLWRLPNVFGKWARPNYNSVVATFCHNLARGQDIRIDDARARLSLLHIDDLIDQWLELIAHPSRESGLVDPTCVYSITLGELGDLLRSFALSRSGGPVGDVGSGLQRALYSTFVSCLAPDSVSYPLQSNSDERGSFVEILRTNRSGQISFLTARPGVTRGGHYHHSKVERFVIVQGAARFRFRHILDGQMFELIASGDEPRVIETIPGWSHDITNIGDGDLVALVWANEQFDPARPDTVRMPL